MSRKANHWNSIESPKIELYALGIYYIINPWGRIDFLMNAFGKTTQPSG